MNKIKTYFFIVALFLVGFLNAQRINISGQLLADDDVEGLHILNKSAAKYIISNEDGNFVILAKVSDTLYMSGVKYKAQQLIITASIIELGEFSVQLIEKVNALNEVVVGEILTGSLQSDLENSDAKPDINFYDLGIPGNTDLPLTQSERRLHDSDHGQFVNYYGIALTINLHKILNRINGDTKEYKERIKRESNELCINRLQSEYSNTLFEAIAIPENFRSEFFQFCMEDKQFTAICEGENTINEVSFLLEKVKLFKTQLNGG